MPVTFAHLVGGPYCCLCFRAFGRDYGFDHMLGRTTLAEPFSDGDDLWDECWECRAVEPGGFALLTVPA